jgi:predicted dehydrogenase
MIGAGRHASSQLHPLFRRLDGATLAAVCDLDRPRAECAARALGAGAAYGDWREMAAAERLDGVVVCVGSRGHAELAPQLMRAGLHVLVEKPHAPSLAASRAMLEASRESGRLCLAAYKKRFTPAYVRALAAIRDPSFGDACYLSCYRAMGGNDQARPDYLWEWGCHAVDLVQWLLGPVSEVQAWRGERDWRAVTINLRFASGAVGNLAMVSPGGNWERLTVLGRGGAAVRVEDGLSCLVHRGNEPVGGFAPTATAAFDGAAITGFLGELQGFVDAIRGTRAPEADIASACHTIAIHEATLRSLAAGGAPQPVEAVEEAACAAR